MISLYHSLNTILVRGDQEQLVTLRAAVDTFAAFAQERQRLYPGWRIQESF